MCTVNPELEIIANRLAQAATPEEVFGEIHAPHGDMVSLLKKTYRQMARVVHPDVYLAKSDQLLAHTAFHLLTDWFNKAQAKIELGEYGRASSSSKIVLQTAKREYVIDGNYVSNQSFNLYPCSFMEHGRAQRAVLKIVRDPHDNDLIENEIRTLQALSRGKEAKKFSPYIPSLIEALVYEDAGVHLRAAVFSRYDGWYSLEDVQKAYARGVNPKDMAWMWRRLLVALGFAHSNGIIHGAVLPCNIWILPEEHGLMLVDWAYAVSEPAITGDCIRAIVSDYADWYPQEMLRKEIPVFGTDIQMSAKCMIWVLGGDPVTKRLPESVPAPIKAFLKGCILPGNRAPQNAWTLKEEFDELIGKLWGARKFHPFYMK